MNVVLVALDTVRADHLGCYGYRHDTSPALDAFAASGTRFERCLAPGIPTTPSYTTTFTGQLPVTHGIVTHGGGRDIDPVRPWLPQILCNAGYATCAVDNLFRMKPWFGRGYETLIDSSQRLGSSHEIECTGINRRAVPWIKNHAAEQFFLFIHYWDVHTPYLPPAKYRPLFYEGDPCDPARKGALHRFYETSMHAGAWRGGWIKELAPPGRELTDIEYLRAMYDSEIRHLDDGLAEVLGAIDDAGLREDTMVVFFADHGEEMYEHDVFFDHHGLYQGNLHVPLLVRCPGRGRAGAAVPHVVQHADIAPTILDAAGLDVPDAMEGRSLLPYITGESDRPIQRTFVTGECTYQRKRAIISGRHKLIVALDKGNDLHKMPPRELYDLEADPGETRNLADEKPEVVRALERELNDWVAAKVAEHGLSGDPIAEQDITIGKGYRAWLEEHHYW